MQQYVAKVTEIMREADQLFETTGGGTRHYVRDLLLPMMEQAGLKIVDATPSPAQPPVNGEEGQFTQGTWIPISFDNQHRLPKKQDFLLRYDNGDIVRHDEEEQPFALATHFMIIPDIDATPPASPAKAEQEGPKPISSCLKDYNLIGKLVVSAARYKAEEFSVHKAALLSAEEIYRLVCSYKNAVEWLDSVVYALEEGASEWETEAKEWKLCYDVVLSALKELTDLKAIKERDGETEDYLQRKPRAWEVAKEISAGHKIEKREQEGVDYKKQYEEANGFICDLAKAFGQAGLGFDDLSWGIYDFLEAAKTKFGEQEGLRWVKANKYNFVIGEIYHVKIRDNEDQEWAKGSGSFLADGSFKWDDGDITPEPLHYNLLILDESAPKEAGQPIESDGRTWYAWTELASPPAQEAGQVDPVALLEWIEDNWYSEPGDRNHWHKKFQYEVKVSHTELAKIYLQQTKQQ